MSANQGFHNLSANSLTLNGQAVNLNLNSQKITSLADPTANSDAANKSYVDTQISNLIDSAPGALNTLNELAAAMNDDANFSTTVTNLIAANEVHIDNVATLSGVAKDSTDLGTFTGSTISANQNIKEALQALETAIESEETRASNAEAANEVHIDNIATLSGVAKDSTDLGTFTGSTISANQNIKEALQALETAIESEETRASNAEAANETHIDNVVSLSGVAKDSTDLGTFTGSTISANQNIKEALQALETAIESEETRASNAEAANETHIDNVVSLSGVAKDSTDLGTFTGSTISANQNIKEALQALETAHEGALLLDGSRVMTNDLDMNGSDIQMNDAAIKGINSIELEAYGAIAKSQDISVSSSGTDLVKLLNMDGTTAMNGFGVKVFHSLNNGTANKWRCVLKTEGASFTDNVLEWHYNKASDHETNPQWVVASRISIE